MNTSPLPISDPDKAALFDVAWIKLRNDPELRFAIQRLSMHELRTIIEHLSTSMLIWLDDKAARTSGR